MKDSITDYLFGSIINYPDQCPLCGETVIPEEVKAHVLKHIKEEALG